jgi:recombinational DNA repair protein (RecF pathway)
LVADAWYEYRTEQGPVVTTERRDAMVFSGAQLIAIRRRDFSESDVVRAAGRLLREVIAFHLDGRELKTRRVLVDIRRTAED